MATATHSETAHHKESSLLSLLSGWGQQGIQTLFATQRILLDLAMRQNANVMHAVRQQLSDPHHSPAAILSEAAEETTTNFLEGQRVLLALGKEQNTLLMEAVKERAGDCPRRTAAINLLQRSFEAFLQMHEEYLKLAGKQTRAWLQSAQAGKPYQPEHVLNFAREGMETFLKAQKHFLDIVSEEATKAVEAKPVRTSGKKPTEVKELARRSTQAMVDAQKAFVDVTGKQMDAQVEAAGKALKLFKPFPLLPLNELAREAVKSYVDAQKALMDVMTKSANGHKETPRPSRPVRRRVKKATATVAVA